MYTKEDHLLSQISCAREDWARHNRMARKFLKLRKATGLRGYGVYWSREMRAQSVLKHKIEDLEDQLIALRRETDGRKY